MGKIKFFIILCFLYIITTSYSQEIRLCDNGGIKLESSNDCICPYSFGGENCEIKDSKEICSNATDLGGNSLLDTSSICCWNKYRTSINLSELKISITDNESSEDKVIRNIYKTYGPWYERDVILSNLLIEKDEVTNQLKMKYSKDLINNILQPSNQQLVDCQDPSNNPIAFTIMIHKINMETIETLFEILYRPYNYYVIHIDQKFSNKTQIEELQDYFYYIQKKDKGNGNKWDDYPNNIKIMKDRFVGIWGAISLVYMELGSYTELFDMMLERKQVTENKNDYQWSHVINLSANDMPCKHIDELSKLLCENKNTTYLEEAEVKKEYRFSLVFMEFYSYIFQFTNQSFTKFECGNQGMLNYFDRSKALDGSQWHILTSSYAHYLISNPIALERLFSFKFSYIPDETFFQSAKPFYPLINDSNIGFCNSSLTRLTLWNTDPLSSETQRYSVELKDVEQITNDTFFIRKVYKKQVKDEIIKKFNLITK